MLKFEFRIDPADVLKFRFLGVPGGPERGPGPSWGVLGHLGGPGERLGGVLGRLGGVLGASWGLLGASWGLPGASWEPPERLGRFPGRPGG